jgi:hypothetical protein
LWDVSDDKCTFLFTIFIDLAQGELFKLLYPAHARPFYLQPTSHIRQPEIR